MNVNLNPLFTWCMYCVCIFFSVCLTEGVQVLSDNWGSSSPRPTSSSSSLASPTHLALVSNTPCSPPPPPVPSHNSRWGSTHKPNLISQYLLTWPFVSSQYPCLWTVGCSELSPSHSPCTSLHEPLGSEGFMPPPGHSRVGSATWPPGPAHSFWEGDAIGRLVAFGEHLKTSYKYFLKRWSYLTVGPFLMVITNSC